MYNPHSHSIYQEIVLFLFDGLLPLGKVGDGGLHRRGLGVLVILQVHPRFIYLDLFARECRECVWVFENSGIHLCANVYLYTHTHTLRELPMALPMDTHSLIIFRIFIFAGNVCTCRAEIYAVRV